MATAYLCDLCEVPCKQASCSTVTITKKNGKNKTFEACPSCTAKIWSGKLNSAPVTSKTKTKLKNHVTESTDEVAVPPEEDESWLNEKIAERKSQKLYQENPIEIVAPMDQANGQCPHYNKSRFINKGGTPYSKCRECGEKLEYSDNLSPRDKSDVRPPRGVRVKESSK